MTSMMAPAFDDEKSLFNYVVRDGNGIKGLVESGLSEVPELYIQPPKERIDKTKATIDQNPPIDLSKLDGPDHDQVVNDIVGAVETVGCFQVVNHGVPIELLESLKIAARNFFSQPLEMKAKYRKGVSPSPLVKYSTSFMPEIEKILEWKDLISMRYTSDDDALQYWPNECKYVALEYIKTTGKMIKTLLQILIRKLGVTEADVDSKVEALIGAKTVSMNFYPQCPNPDLTVGNGRHTDMAAVTVLLQDDIGGLYVKSDSHEEEWMEISPIPGALVINIGDSLQIVSNGKYKSAEHRVGTTSNKSRVSVPLFTLPKSTEVIGPLPEVVERDGLAGYRDVLFQDYMIHHFRCVHGVNRSLDFVQI